MEFKEGTVNNVSLNMIQLLLFLRVHLNSNILHCSDDFTLNKDVCTLEI